jgi:hypothetical protein
MPTHTYTTPPPPGPFDRGPYTTPPTATTTPMHECGRPHATYQEAIDHRNARRVTLWALLAAIALTLHYFPTVYLQGPLMGVWLLTFMLRPNRLQRDPLTRKGNHS